MTKTLVLSLLKDIRDNMEPRIFTWETEDYFAELTYDDEVSGLSSVRQALFLAQLIVERAEESDPFFDEGD